jgi:hypothetical protein
MHIMIRFTPCPDFALSRAPARSSEQKHPASFSVAWTPVKWHDVEVNVRCRVAELSLGSHFLFFLIIIIMIVFVT